MKKFSEFISEIVIKIGSARNNQTSAFMDEFDKTTKPHPINNRARVVGNTTVHLSTTSKGIHIHDIQSHSQGSGAGTEALKHITGLADKHGVSLGLNASGYASTSTTRLKSWYKKHGFKSSKGDDRNYMTRTPQ